MNKHILHWGLLAAVVLSGAVHATLIDRGEGLVYDSIQGITWMQNGHFAAMNLTDSQRDDIISTVGSVAGHTLTTRDFNKNLDRRYTGKMTWWGAIAWADQLVFAGFDDWRLPITFQPDPSCSVQTDSTPPQGSGFFCKRSEMGHLFYIDGIRFPDEQEPFFNIQNLTYWSETEFALTPLGAWQFDFGFGVQRSTNKENLGRPWVVRDGDVIFDAPEPGTLGLLGLGILGLVITRRKVNSRA